MARHDRPKMQKVLLKKASVEIEVLIARHDRPSEPRRALADEILRIKAITSCGTEGRPVCSADSVLPMIAETACAAKWLRSGPHEGPAPRARADQWRDNQDHRITVCWTNARPSDRGSDIPPAGVATRRFQAGETGASGTGSPRMPIVHELQVFMSRDPLGE